MTSPFVLCVETVLAADLDTLSLGELQAHALELQQISRRLAGRADQALAALQVRAGWQVPENPGSSEAPLLMSVQTWWREATRIHGTQAGRDVRRAAVVDRLRIWGQAVTDGILTQAHVQALCRLDGKLPEQELLDSQLELVAVAAALNPVELGQWVRHLIATWCEPELEAEQDKAENNAWLQLDKRPDGRLAGRFVISSEDSEALLTVLEPLARRQGLSDGRSSSRRRADALVEVFAAASTWLDLPASGGRQTHVSYVVPSGWACRDTPPSLTDLLRSGTLPLGLSVREVPVFRPASESQPWPRGHWQGHPADAGPPPVPGTVCQARDPSRHRRAPPPDRGRGAGGHGSMVGTPDAGPDRSHPV